MAMPMAPTTHDITGKCLGKAELDELDLQPLPALMVYVCSGLTRTTEWKFTALFLFYFVFGRAHSIKVW